MQRYICTTLEKSSLLGFAAGIIVVMQYVVHISYTLEIEGHVETLKIVTSWEHFVQAACT